MRICGAPESRAAMKSQCGAPKIYRRGLLLIQCSTGVGSTGDRIGRKPTDPSVMDTEILNFVFKVEMVCLFFVLYKNS